MGGVLYLLAIRFECCGEEFFVAVVGEAVVAELFSDQGVLRVGIVLEPDSDESNEPGSFLVGEVCAGVGVTVGAKCFRWCCWLVAISATHSMQSRQRVLVGTAIFKQVHLVGLWYKAGSSKSRIKKCCCAGVFCISVPITRAYSPSGFREGLAGARRLTLLLKAPPPNCFGLFS